MYQWIFKTFLYGEHLPICMEDANYKLFYINGLHRMTIDTRIHILRTGWKRPFILLYSTSYRKNKNFLFATEVWLRQEVYLLQQAFGLTLAVSLK